jgi:hypothetical protein
MQSKLTKDQRRKLESLGFDFEENDTKKDRTWNEMFVRLKAYKKEFGTTKVPLRFKGDATGLYLGTWVSRQRQKQAKGILRQDRLERLNSVGFVWHGKTTSGPEEQWMDDYEKLVEFQHIHGHCRVPCDYDKPFEYWVDWQRQQAEQGLLRQDRVVLLDKIGCFWKVQERMSHDQRWKAQYDKLVEYQRIHGHCCVSPSADTKSLCSWIYSQKYQKEAGTLIKERKNLLDKIGFVWLAGPTRIAPKGSDTAPKEIPQQSSAALLPSAAATMPARTGPATHMKKKPPAKSPCGDVARSATIPAPNTDGKQGNSKQTVSLESQQNIPSFLFPNNFSKSNVNMKLSDDGGGVGPSSAPGANGDGGAECATKVRLKFDSTKHYDNDPMNYFLANAYDPNQKVELAFHPDNPDLPIWRYTPAFLSGSCDGKKRPAIDLDTTTGSEKATAGTPNHKKSRIHEESVEDTEDAEDFDYLVFLDCRS